MGIDKILLLSTFAQLLKIKNQTMKKNYISLLTIMLSFITFNSFAQMSGTYSVGNALSNYQTIREATDSLQSQGVSGAVIFNIVNGTYTDTISIDSVNGISTTNTITFQSQSGNTSLVTINSSDTLFNLNINHVNFKNLTLENTIARPIIYSKSIDGLTIENCNFNSFGYSVHIEDPNFSNTTIAKNISIKSSSFDDGEIYIETKTVSNIDIENNSFNTDGRSVYLYADFNISNINFKKNTVTSTGSRGFYLYTDAGSISNFFADSNIIKSFDEAIYLEAAFDITNTTISNSVIKGYYPSTSDEGINMYTNSGAINTLLIDNVSIDSVGREALDLNSDNEIKNITITNSNIRGYSDEAVYISADKAVENVTSMNNTYRSNTRESFEVNVGGSIKNIRFLNDSCISLGAYGIYLNSDIQIENISIDSSYLSGDTTNTSEGGLYIYSSNRNINNVDVKNSTVYGGRAAYIYAQTNVSKVNIDNALIRSKYKNGVTSSATALHIQSSSSDIELVTISNSIIKSDTSIGIYLNADDAGIRFVDITNTQINSVRDGIYMYTYTGMEGVLIKNCDVLTNGYSYNSGIYMYNDYTSLKNIIIDSCNIKGSQYGVYTESYYNKGIENVIVSNNTINVTNTGVNSTSQYGVYGYSDNGIDGYKVQNNIINTNNGSGQGVYLGGYSGGTSNTLIENNTMNIYGTGSEGVYLEYANDNNKILYNTIDTNGTDYIDYGFYVTGEYQPYSKVVIKGNYVTNAENGAYFDYETKDIELLNNTFSANDPGVDGYGVYIEENTNGKIKINGNQFYSLGGDEAIYLDEIRSDSNFKTEITNNFFSNYDYVYIYDAQNILIANNSFTTTANQDFFYLDYYNKNIEIYNNIVKVDTGTYTSNLFYLDFPNQIKGMDYNVSNIDTAKSNYVYDGYYGITYKSLEEWDSLTGFSQNSFIEEVDFINDTSDLHISCSNTTLNGGLVIAGLTTDIDGNTRSSSPTIGADEILLNDNNIFALTSIDARPATAIILDAGASSGNVTYLWNTGETTQTIVADTSGFYRVTLTDDCGSYTDSIEVALGGIASINEQDAFNTSVYPNPSNGLYTVTLDKFEDVTLTVFNTSGKIVISKNLNNQSTKIDLSNQTNGFYILRLVGDNKVATKRLIKN